MFCNTLTIRSLIVMFFFYCTISFKHTNVIRYKLHTWTLSLCSFGALLYMSSNSFNSFWLACDCLNYWERTCQYAIWIMKYPHIINLNSSINLDNLFNFFSKRNKKNFFLVLIQSWFFFNMQNKIKITLSVNIDIVF